MSLLELDLPERYNASDVLFRNLDAGRGDKTAVLCGDSRTSYAELAAAAARVGNGLRELGLPRGARVLLLLLDTPAFPAAFFGALRAGYLPIPVNTVLQTDDYAYLLRDSGAGALIVDGALYPRVEPVRGRCPDLDQVIAVGAGGAPDVHDWGAWLEAAGTELDPAPAGADEPAFWLYSSGSTGHPKGVVHLHRSIPYTLATYAEQVLGIREDDLVFSASKAFHAYGLGNSLSFPFGAGAACVLFPGRPTPEAVFAEIARHRPTLFFTVPTLYAAMLAAADGDGGPDLGRVRRCVSAGEALPADVYRRFHQRFGVEILDGIGSTELLHIFISNRPGEVRPGTSGRAVPGYEAEILDEDGRPAAAGESGDLLVRGGSATTGYWQKPEKTAATLREGRVFTGDRYRQDEDGFFHYEGRSDDMLKVGGQWVSPIEVENTLIEHPAVLECAVVAARDGDGMEKPKAFVVLCAGHGGSPELAAELQAFVKSKIAPYKYPRRIEFRAELPKTVTGKIQRFLLRDSCP
jgi:benzoate-CoA ligase